MAGTVDSGNETLFSDESPCDLAASPTGRGPEHPTGAAAPPRIQPFSGVLEKGKAVIRPIAFKPAARFGVSGERYGSTPALARPGSRPLHYGSSGDLRHSGHCSLDRRLLPPAPLPLSSLPLRPTTGYDSAESVRKSPGAESGGNKSSSGLSVELTPSPSDSGVSELEAALRERDSELAYLRQTMEHNEQVIFRVYQEKERAWERELRRLRSAHESRLRASAQRALRLEQLLVAQTYQLQQDKKRLSAEAQRATCRASELRDEVTTLRERLEETEWGLCRKTGELSLLKTQLKGERNERVSEGYDLVQLRGDYRSARDTLERREREVTTLKREAEARERELAALRAEVESLRNAETGAAPCGGACPDAERLRRELEASRHEFEHERVTWAQEKEKVLRYQRQLQLNYVQMFRRSRALETEVESLTLELELCSKAAATASLDGRSPSGDS